MAQGPTFELVGPVIGLEIRKKDGAPIPGFWSLKIDTQEGERTCSFNSTRAKDKRNPKGEQEPHPDFPILQTAQATGQWVRVKGNISSKGEKTFKNGTSAELVPEGTPMMWSEDGGWKDAQQGQLGAAQVGSASTGATGLSGSQSASAALDTKLEEAWRALAVIVPLLEVETPAEDEQEAWIGERSLKLIHLARQIAARL